MPAPCLQLVAGHLPHLLHVVVVVVVVAPLQYLISTPAAILSYSNADRSLQSGSRRRARPSRLRSRWRKSWGFTAGPRAPSTATSLFDPPLRISRGPMPPHTRPHTLPTHVPTRRSWFYRAPGDYTNRLGIHTDGSSLIGACGARFPSAGTPRPLGGPSCATTSPLFRTPLSRIHRRLPPHARRMTCSPLSLCGIVC